MKVGNVWHSTLSSQNDQKRIWNSAVKMSDTQTIISWAILSVLGWWVWEQCRPRGPVQVCLCQEWCRKPDLLGQLESNLGLSMAEHDWDINHRQTYQAYQDYVLDKGGDIQSCTQLIRTISLEQQHILVIRLSACGRCLSCETKAISINEDRVVREMD